MSAQPPSSLVPDQPAPGHERDNARPSGKGAWSPIPLTIEQHVPAEYTFAAPLANPQADLQAHPSGPPAAHQAGAHAQTHPSGRPDPTTAAPSRPPAAHAPDQPGLPKRVRRLGPVNADSIQPTGPVPKYDLLLPPVPPAPSHLVVDVPEVPVFAPTPELQFPAGVEVLPPLTPDTTPSFQRSGGSGVPSAPSNTFTPPVEVFPNATKPAPQIEDPFAAAPSGYNSTHNPTADELSSWPPPQVGGPTDSLGVADLSMQAHANAGSQHPPMGVAYMVPTLHHGTPVQDPATPAPTPVGPGHPAPAGHGAQQQGESLVATIDWRIMAFVGLLAAYLPLLFRSLLGVRLSHPLGTTVLAELMVPLAFTVIAARRPRRSTIDDRHVDLVVGAVAAVMSLVCTWVLPRSLGGISTLWRPEWLALPFALFSLYTLLWGVRFAWDMRNSLLVSLLASPLLFVPLLGRPFTPLSGDINKYAYDIARYALPIESVGYASARAGVPLRDIDARGLIDGRILSAAVMVMMIGLLLVSRVDGRSAKRGGNGRASGLTRRMRKLGAFVASLATFWLLDLIVSTVAIVFAGFAPQGWAKYFTSPIVGLLPTLIALFTFAGWCRRFGLFLPSKLGVVSSATKLPAHGPRSRSDHAITFLTIGIICLTAIAAGLRPTLHPVSSLPAEVDIAAPIAPKGWKPAEPVLVTSFHSYYGAHSEWVRTRLDGPSDAPVDQVNVDRVASSIDLLRMFNATTTYDLGRFRPVQSRTIDLGAGSSAVQETYYDATSASAWSIVSALIETPTGTYRISLSARAAGDRSPVPLPTPQATRNLLLRTSEPAPGIGKQLKDEKINRTADSVAELFRSYSNEMRSGLVFTETAPQTQPKGAPDDIVDDAGFVQ